MSVRRAICVLSLLSLGAAAHAQEEANVAASPPGGALEPGQAFTAEDPVRVRLPQDDWHVSYDDSMLPPPPGWVAGEFASLGPTMGSSPESEPLAPGDELTMETGRLASHKSGFFQKYSLSGAWFPRGDDGDLGMVEAKTFITVALPLPSRDFPLLITPGFDVIALDGPDATPQSPIDPAAQAANLTLLAFSSPDLPPQLYDAYLDFMWLPKLSERWMAILALTPGIYSDLDDLQSDAFRLKAKALVRYDWIPSRVQILFGILYLNRNDVNWLPAGGVVWDPNDDVHLEILFPRPKLAYRMMRTGLHEDWIYLAGEFGGDTWSIRRGDAMFDMITYVDWRVYLGIERMKAGGAGIHFEVGYVFSREIQFDSSTPDYHSGDTVMLRAGFDF